MSKSGTNVYDASAGALGSAGTNAMTAGNMYATGTGNNGQDAYGALDYAGNLLGSGYGGGYDPTGYNAKTVGAAPYISEGMSRYYNPYTSQVIDRTRGDISRLLGMQLGQVGADASAAGAFGGSRHGLVEAETNRAALDTMADTSATLRSNMFNTAAGLAGQDISNLLGVRLSNQNAINQARQFGASAQNAAGQFNSQSELARISSLLGLAGGYQNQQGLNLQDLLSRAGGLTDVSKTLAGLGTTGYGIGSDIGNKQLQYGTMGQALNQQMLDSVRQMFESYVNQPTNLLNLRLASVGATPGQNTGTTTQTTQNEYGPGAMLAALLKAGSSMFSFSPINLFGP